MIKIITKQLLLSTLRCSKATYLHLKSPELEEDTMDPGILYNAQQFEMVARELLAPGGIDLKMGYVQQHQLVEQTKDALKKTNSTLYQATFLTSDHELAMADVFVKAKLRNVLYEIKSSTGPLTAEQIYDAAYQYHIITKTGTKVDDVYIAYVNKEFVRDGEVTDDLLVIEDVTTAVKKVQPQIKVLLDRVRNANKAKQAPPKEIGMYCTDPRPCAFKNHCWSGLPTNNIFEIRNMRIGTKLKLYERGIVEFKDITPQVKLTDNQWIQVSCTLDNKMIISPEALKGWVNNVNQGKGIFYLDFETIAPAIPYIGCKPYTQIPFQFSLHYKNRKTEDVDHFEFIADPFSEEDMREVFVETLLKKLESDKEAVILTYNMSFEKGVLRNLAKQYPKLESAINKIISRIDDLMIPFKEKWYYDARFAGSYSIKNVLPVVCPDLSYENLSINNGSTASYEFSRMKTISRNEAEEIKKNLLEYCKLDTLAMVKILEFLVQTCKIQ